MIHFMARIASNRKGSFRVFMKKTSGAAPLAKCVAVILFLQSLKLRLFYCVANILFKP